MQYCKEKAIDLVNLSKSQLQIYLNNIYNATWLPEEIVNK